MVRVPWGFVERLTDAARCAALMAEVPAKGVRKTSKKTAPGPLFFIRRTKIRMGDGRGMATLPYRATGCALEGGRIEPGPGTSDLGSSEVRHQGLRTTRGDHRSRCHPPFDRTGAQKRAMGHALVRGCSDANNC